MLWMDDTQIFTEPAYGDHLQMNQFWYWSGSRSGSGTAYKVKRIGKEVCSDFVTGLFQYSTTYLNYIVGITPITHYSSNVRVFLLKQIPKIQRFSQ